MGTDCGCAAAQQHLIMALTQVHLSQKHLRLAALTESEAMIRASDHGHRWTGPPATAPGTQAEGAHGAGIMAAWTQVAGDMSGAQLDRSPITAAQVAGGVSSGVEVESSPITAHRWRAACTGGG